MKYKIYNSPISSEPTVVDIVDTEKGLIVEILEGPRFHSKESIVNKFINSIKEWHEVGYEGENESEFLKKTLLPKKEKLMRELAKIEFIEKVIGKSIREESIKG